MAIFSRDLSAEEVQQNFAAGPSGRPSPEQIAARKLKAATQHFESTVAPIIARHCLECHDAATHKGGLNLSTKMAAMKGSEDGAVIVARLALHRRPAGTGGRRRRCRAHVLLLALVRALELFDAVLL